MTAFYDEMYAVAIELIAEFGRDVTLVRLDRASDTQRPWELPATVAQETLTLKAAFVNPATLERLGFRATFTAELQSAVEVAIIPSKENLLRFNQLQDSLDGQLWRITAIDRMAPGNTPLLWFVGVTR